MKKILDKKGSHPVIKSNLNRAYYFNIFIAYFAIFKMKIIYLNL